MRKGGRGAERGDRAGRDSRDGREGKGRREGGKGEAANPGRLRPIVRGCPRAKDGRERKRNGCFGKEA